MFKFAEEGNLRDMVDDVVREHSEKKVLPSKFQDEKAVFENMMLTKGREKALADDAKSIAMIMLATHSKDPESQMGASSYWQFIKRFHTDYYQSVVNLSKRMIQYHSADLKKLVPPVAPAGGQGGAGGAPGGMPGGDMGGGGMPPPMAAGSKMKREAKLYIYREDKKPHKLIGTIASEIVAGKQQFLDEEGMPFVMRPTSGERMIISYYAQTSKVSMSINEEMPDKIINEIENFLAHHQIKDSKNLAKSSYARIRKVKNFDLLPVSLAFTSPSNCIMLRNGIGMEPKETHELRVRLGKIIFGYIKSLQQAMKAEALEFVTLKSYLPVSTFPGLSRVSEEERKDIHNGDKPLNNVMKILSPEEVRSSSDIRSLLMTMTSDPQNGKIAAIRLCEIICKNADAIDSVGLTPADIDAISKNEHGKYVSMALELSNKDVADLLSAYMDGDTLTQYLIGCIVESRNKFDVVEALPEIVLAGGILHPELMSKMSENDPEALIVFKKILNTKSQKYKAEIEKKLIRFLAVTGDMELERLAREGNWPAACCFIMAKRAEDGTFTPELLNFKSIKPDNDNLVLAATACIANEDSKDIRAIHSKFKISPLSIQFVAGKTFAKHYMKMTRTNWDGNLIPTANEIFSCPDNPMNLASSLADIEDVVGLLALLHVCGTKYRDGSKTCADTIKFIMNKLDEYGRIESGYAVTNSVGIQVDELGSVLDEASPSAEKMMAYLNAGNDIAAAVTLTKIFEQDEEIGRAILEVTPQPKDKITFIEMLPLKLVSDAKLPAWAKSVITHSFVTPNGLVVTGSFGIYKTKDHAFASAKAYALSGALSIGR